MGKKHGPEGTIGKLREAEIMMNKTANKFSPVVGAGMASYRGRARPRMAPHGNALASRVLDGLGQRTGSKLT